MGFLQPDGWVECETCWAQVEAEMIEMADEGMWSYDPESLPEGWIFDSWSIWCPECAPKIIKELGLEIEQKGETDEDKGSENMG